MSIFRKYYYVPYEWWDKIGRSWHGSVEIDVKRFHKIDIDYLEEQIEEFIVSDTGKQPISIEIISINKL